MSLEYNSLYKEQLEDVSTGIIENSRFESVFSIDIDDSPIFNISVPVVLSKEYLDHDDINDDIVINKSCGTLKTCQFHIEPYEERILEIKNNSVYKDSVVLISISEYIGSAIPSVHIKEIKDGAFVIRIINMSLTTILRHF